MHGSQPGAAGIFQVCQVTSDGNNPKRTAQPTLAWSVARNDLTQLGVVVEDLVANLRATRGPTPIRELRPTPPVASSQGQQALPKISELLELGRSDVRHSLALRKLERQELTLERAKKRQAMDQIAGANPMPAKGTPNYELREMQQLPPMSCGAGKHLMQEDTQLLLGLLMRTLDHCLLDGAPSATEAMLHIKPGP